MTLSRAVLFALVTASISACGARGAADADLADATFEGEPLARLTSRSGALQVAVRAFPAPPAVGASAFELVVTDDAGAPSEVAVSVLPWMPAHGHGTAVQPSVHETGAGVFVATPVYLYMPGRWELRVGLSNGVKDDAATVVIDLR